jgi:hypothetical protein
MCRINSKQLFDITYMRKRVNIIQLYLADPR